MIHDPDFLIGLGVIIFLVMVIPAWRRAARFSRCPKCRKRGCLEYMGFDVRDKVVGQSGTTFGGGAAGGIIGRLLGFMFGHASRHNADPFIREWGTARFRCKKCSCTVEIDTRRDGK